MRLDHGGLLVSDVERAARFYTDALGLERIPRPSTFDTPGAWLKVGDHHQIHLIGETEDGRAAQMNPGYDPSEIAIGYGNHLALVVTTSTRPSRVPASTASSRAARSSPAATASAARSSPIPTATSS